MSVFFFFYNNVPIWQFWRFQHNRCFESVDDIGHSTFSAGSLAKSPPPLSIFFPDGQIGHSFFGLFCEKKCSLLSALTAIRDQSIVSTKQSSGFFSTRMAPLEIWVNDFRPISCVNKSKWRKINWSRAIFGMRCPRCLRQPNLPAYASFRRRWASSHLSDRCPEWFVNSEIIAATIWVHSHDTAAKSQWFPWAMGILDHRSRFHCIYPPAISWEILRWCDNLSIVWIPTRYFECLDSCKLWTNRKNKWKFLLLYAVFWCCFCFRTRQHQVQRGDATSVTNCKMSKKYTHSIHSQTTFSFTPSCIDVECVMRLHFNWNSMLIEVCGCHGGRTHHSHIQSVKLFYSTEHRKKMNQTNEIFEAHTEHL